MLVIDVCDITSIYKKAKKYAYTDEWWVRTADTNIESIVLLYIAFIIIIITIIKIIILSSLHIQENNDAKNVISLSLRQPPARVQLGPYLLPTL